METYHKINTIDDLASGDAVCQATTNSSGKVISVTGDRREVVEIIGRLIFITYKSSKIHINENDRACAVTIDYFKRNNFVRVVKEKPKLVTMFDALNAMAKGCTVTYRPHAGTSSGELSLSFYKFSKDGLLLWSPHIQGHFRRAEMGLPTTSASCAAHCYEIVGILHQKENVMKAGVFTHDNFIGE